MRTLDRFSESMFNETRKIVTYCDYCKEDILEGDYIFEFQGEEYCSEDCFTNHQTEQGFLVRREV